MKISAQDEYGLRILLRIAGAKTEEGLSIPQLSEVEGLSTAYMGKITRALRMAGLITSTRGHKGGYVLSKPADEIVVKEIVDSMGGALFDEDFCGNHVGQKVGNLLCTHSVDCSVRSLWRIVQDAVDKVLENITLADLIASESGSSNFLEQVLKGNELM